MVVANISLAQVVMPPPAAETPAAEPAIARVTVTNLMKGQILTPAVFITHNADAAPLFVPGRPASRELAALAEQGSTSGLLNKFRADVDNVLDTTVLRAFIHPTRTSTVSVKFNASHRLISSASMLEMTNDGFVSLLAVEVPCSGAKTYFLGGWDAGSEANTELCSQIPAPCPRPRRLGSCSPGGAEGAVHVHSGIHGCGGFPPEIYDWGHPVARVTIEVDPELSPAGSLEAACPAQYPVAPPPHE
ncbi:MAG: spondin domain-containing protein [Bryobacterales bacterium]|nr:spondin domain-containing protein [Bryobacterales bacterium]